MFVLSILPLNSLAIVFIGLFTSEASIDVPSEICAGDIFPKVSLCGLACSSVRLYYNTLSGILSLMSREKSMNIAITIIVAVLVMFGFWIYDLKQDVGELRTTVAEQETEVQTLVEALVTNDNRINGELDTNTQEIERVEQNLLDLVRVLQNAGY